MRVSSLFKTVVVVRGGFSTGNETLIYGAHQKWRPFIFSLGLFSSKKGRKTVRHKKSSYKLRETNQHYGKDQFGEQYEICDRCHVALRLNPDLEITHCPNCAAKLENMPRLKTSSSPPIGIVRYVFL